MAPGGAIAALAAGGGATLLASSGCATAWLRMAPDGAALEATLCEPCATAAGAARGATIAAFTTRISLLASLDRSAAQSAAAAAAGAPAAVRAADVWVAAGDERVVAAGSCSGAVVAVVATGRGAHLLFALRAPVAEGADLGREAVCSAPAPVLINNTVILS